MTDGENGLLVPPGDEAALAKALATLLENDGLRAQMGVRSRERAVAYGWDRVAQAFHGSLKVAAGGAA